MEPFGVGEQGDRGFLDPHTEFSVQFCSPFLFTSTWVTATAFGPQFISKIKKRIWTLKTGLAFIQRVTDILSGMSCLHHFLAVPSLAGYLTSLCFGVLICKIRVLPPLCLIGRED